MPLKLRIGYWIRGMKLKEGVEKLFHKDNDKELGKKLADEEQPADPEQDYIGELAEQAVKIAELAKEWINSPIGEFITKVIPGDTDDKIKDILVKQLPVIIAGLTGVQNAGDIEAALKPIKFTNNYFWDKFFHDFAKAVGYSLSDREINHADLVFAVELMYQTIFGKKEAA